MLFDAGFQPRRLWAEGIHRLRARLSAPHLVEGTILALPYLVLCIWYSDYLPLWDAGVYYHCIIDHARTTLNPLAFNCANHPTMGYFWVPALLQRLLHGSYFSIIVYNALLGWFALSALADMSRLLLPEREHRIERMLLLASIACCPVVTSSIIQLTPDYGVFVFSVCLSRALLRRHWLASVLWGLLASLSKESGGLIYGITLLVYLVAYVTRAPGDMRSKLAALRERSVLLIVPILGLIGTITLIAVKGTKILWVGDGATSVPRQFLSISFLDNVFPASLATIFEVNAMWLPALAVLAYFGRQVWRKVFGFRAEQHANPALEFLVLLFCFTVYFLTRFRTVLNIRYYLPIFPWFFFLAGRGLVELRAATWFRRGFAVAVLGLTVFSNFRSLDPVSRWQFRTIAMGKHSLYNMTSMTQECCGYGRDQLVYNLEFAEYHYLLNQALPFILRDRSHVMGAHPLTDWFVFESLDLDTAKRAIPSENTFKPDYLTVWQVSGMAEKPPVVYYLELPNMREQEELARWKFWYNPGPRHLFERNGYAIAVQELFLKK